MMPGVTAALKVTKAADGEEGLNIARTHDADLMEFHRGRPEIQDALVSGKGAGIRESNTPGTRLIYTAYHDSETQLIFRAARTVQGLRDGMKRMVYTAENEKINYCTGDEGFVSIMMRMRFLACAVFFVLTLFQGISPIRAVTSIVPGDLARAAGELDLQQINMLLSLGAEPDIPDEWGWTALNHVVEAGRFDLTERLLEAGADPNLPGDDGVPPLIRTVLNGREDLMMLLLSNGADPNFVADLPRDYGSFSMMNNDGDSAARPVSALSLALDVGDYVLVRRLMDFGASAFLLANPDTPQMNPLELPSPIVALDARMRRNLAEVMRWANSEDWDMPVLISVPDPGLHRAARDGDWRMIRALLDEGDSPDSADEFGVTPLMSAAANGHYSEVVLLLQRGADPAVTDSRGRGAPAYAAAGGQARILPLLLNTVGFDPGEAEGDLQASPYYFAVAGGERTVLDALLEVYDPPKTGDSEGIGLLMMAAWKTDAYMVKKLLPRMDVEQTDENGRSALAWCAAAFDRDRRRAAQLGRRNGGFENYNIARTLASSLRNPRNPAVQPTTLLPSEVIEAWSPGRYPAAAEVWRDMIPAPIPMTGGGDLTLYRILRDEEPPES